MHRGDARGNGQYLNVDPYMDNLVALAAPRCFMSVEQVVETDELATNGPVQSMLISRLMTHGVVEAPKGAHFTECVPDYGARRGVPEGVRRQRQGPRPVGGVEGEVPRLRRPRRVPEGGRPVSDRAQELPSECGPAKPRAGKLWNRRRPCVIAVAECFRGDGEIMANPIGTIPAIGGRLARDVFEPDLVMTDGEALLVANGIPLGVDDPDKTVEAWNPYRTMFDVVWSGRRHVMMGASQLDPYGNQNFAFIGDPTQARRCSCSACAGAPGNTVQNVTSYWIPSHSPKVFVEQVDVVSGIGYDRAAELGDWVREHHELRRVVTNLARARLRRP